MTAKMTIKERLEAFWAGERPDEIPFTIYQNEWRHTADHPAWQNLYNRGMGVTWHLPTTRQVWHNAEFANENHQENGQIVSRNIIKTPIGEIYESFIDGWRQKFYIETAQDYAVMTYVVQNIEILPAYERFHEFETEMEAHHIPMVALGRTPNQIILVDYVGLENYAFHLFDLRDEMAALYDALLEQLWRRVELAAAGPGRFVSVLENFTAETVGPVRYGELLLPVYQELFPTLRNAGKIVGVHYDGQLASCKDLIAKAPVDLIESVTPPPEGDMTLAECRAAWPEMLLWSNINVGCYDLPPAQLKQAVLERVAQAAPDGRRLAFEVSEQYPYNWPESLPVVLDALRETRA